LISITEAVQQIKQGKVIAYPTESVYGLGCDPWNEQAFLKLLKLKGRALEKGVILIAANLDQVKDLAYIENEEWSEQVIGSWKDSCEAVTWILPAKKTIPYWVTGGRDTVAIRVSHHPGVVALCNSLGSALVSTSANLSKQLPAMNALDCSKIFPNVAILAGKTMGLESPSQIWDAKSLIKIR